uniref:Uncharacterized protein n=1 Tax=Anguilla anguilla TaxID=7936 RepID=A0A0E9Y0F5_ANGAN
MWLAAQSQSSGPTTRTIFTSPALRRQGLIKT